ncbi:MAG TPA: histidine phosphatase family protein [Phenylobacterium sp.]|uniref:SixA phosphatase family protein n=1 Tax=Phenylobacterium sp. TaxID=1871053 RepID=UPI002B47E03B|nr:histidine phosphatase family protein [Phenylobacterium sp.]HKR88650.1 histidine phosphatase family protein [Phenylobacterium sp.]
MDRLILLRHAKAEGEAPSGDDFDRALAPRGQREARAVGMQLAALGLRPDLAVVSPSARTRETWELVELSVAGAAVKFEPALYNAEAGAIRKIAEKTGAGARTVIVVAHNPGLQELAVRLMRDGTAPAECLSRAQRHFPPGAVAVFDFDAEGRATVDQLFYPERGL